MLKISNNIKLAILLTGLSVVISGMKANIGVGIFQVVLYLVILYLIVASE